MLLISCNDLVHGLKAPTAQQASSENGRDLCNAPRSRLWPARQSAVDLSYDCDVAGVGTA